MFGPKSKGSTDKRWEGKEKKSLELCSKFYDQTVTRKKNQILVVQSILSRGSYLRSRWTPFKIKVIWRIFKIICCYSCFFSCLFASTKIRKYFLSYNIRKKNRFSTKAVLKLLCILTPLKLISHIFHSTAGEWSIRALLRLFLFIFPFNKK